MRLNQLLDIDGFFPPLINLCLLIVCVLYLAGHIEDGPMLVFVYIVYLMVSLTSPLFGPLYSPTTHRQLAQLLAEANSITFKFRV
jgi:hypothetical protein